MKVTFSKADLDKPEARNALVAIIGDSQHGGFMRIHGFRSKTGYGEVQDTTYCKGIDYGTAVQRSLAMLDAIEATPDFSVTVTRGIWADDKGNENPSGRKKKGFENAKTVTETYDMASPVMKDALAKVRKSLTAPERPTKEYEKLGNGVYQSEEGTLYVRDLRLVAKHVVIHGDYPFKATTAATAVQNAIKRDMPVSKYRMFRMDGDFEAVTLGGHEISPEAPQGKVEAEKVEETEAATEAATA